MRGGERGIRTPGSFHFNGFQDRRNRPLCHLSVLSYYINAYNNVQCNCFSLYLQCIFSRFDEIARSARTISIPSPTAPYKSAAIDHSAISPYFVIILMFTTTCNAIIFHFICGAYFHGLTGLRALREQSLFRRLRLLTSPPQSTTLPSLRILLLY